MAFPPNMISVRYQFSFEYGATPLDIQDTGFWCVLTGPGSAGAGDWQTFCDSVAAEAVQAWSDNMTEGLFSPGVVGVSAKAYRYGVDHTQPAETIGTAAFTGSTAWRGGGTVGLPPENSVVLSLYGYDPSSYTPQKGRKRGRMYLPTPATSILDEFGLISTGNQNTLLGVGTGLLNEFGGHEFDNGAEETIFCTPSVASTAGQFATAVAFLRLGRVVDTQRRRRNKITEEYVTGPI